MNTFKTIATMVVGLIFSQICSAQTFETTGNGSGDWTSPATWNCTGGGCPNPTVPPKDFDATVLVRHNIFRDDNTDMKVLSGGHLDLLGAMLTTDGGLVVEGSLTLESSLIHLQNDKNFDLTGTAVVNVNNTCLTSEMGNFKNDGTMDGNASIYLPGDGNIDAGGGTSTGTYEYCIGVGNLTWAGPGSISEDCNIATGVPSFCDLSVILPVELMSFSVVEARYGMMLNWSTATEIESSHFVIEYSSDGQEFIDVGTVSAAGMTMAQNDYQYRHMPPKMADRIYYRLKSVDLDGDFEYSKVIEHDIQSHESSVHPSLARVGDALAMRGFSGKVRLISSNGDQDWLNIGDEGVFFLPTDDLSPGMYTLMSEKGKIHRVVLVN